MDHYEDFVDNLPPEIEITEARAAELLSKKSRKIYEKQYDEFNRWCNQKNEQNVTEKLLLLYFGEKSGHVKASTLWSQYSMLKAMLIVKDNIDISKFKNLLMYLKKMNYGYKPFISKALTAEQVEQFLTDAPDEEYLMIKVALILGIAGACRGHELVNLLIDDVTDLGSSILFNIKKSRNEIDRRFIVTNSPENSVDFVKLCKKYMALRKFKTPHSRFFVQYRNENCSTQPVGRNSFGKLPQRIAEFLKLPEASLYTGHCFRRTSASLKSGESGNVLKRLDRWQARNVTDGLAKLRATATDLEAEPSTSAASNDDYEFEIKSDLPIEHVDVGSVSTSCEEQSDSNLDFLPESEEPPLPKYQRTVPSAPKDMKSYCRLCLNPVTKVQMICLGDFHDINYPSRTVQFKRNKILQTDMYLRMIRTLLPNFDHDLVYNPVMCNDCSTRLQMASDFVEQCMATQKLIQQYKDTNCPLEKMVSCEDVVYSKSQLQPNSEEGPSQPKQRKIATRPSKSIAKSKSTVKPQRETRSVLPETQTVSPADEILMSGNVSIKMEDIDDEEMQIEEKYEITQEEICYIKQECVEEAPRIQTDDVTIKTEPEHPLPTNSVIKSEPCLDSTVTPDPISVKEFSTTDASCNVNDKLSSLVELPSQLSSTVPISNSPDLNQVLVPETCISAVNSKGFSSVNSQFENSQNR